MTSIDQQHRKMPLRTVFNCWKGACFLAVFGLPALGLAEQGSDDTEVSVVSEISVDRIALELSNPVTLLRSVAIDVEYRTYQGSLPEAGEQDAYRTVFTPSWPIKLSNGKSLLMRATIPVYGGQPYWKPVWYLDYAEFLIRQLPYIDETAEGFSDGHGHLGAVGFDIGYGGVSENGFISMVGIANAMPTSDDQSARRGQWLIGPELALGQITKWGLYGFRAKHLTNIDGTGEQEVDYDTNETTLELFFAYALGNGWQIESNPVILYDWEAVSDNEWNVPVGLGVSKTMMLGKMPMKFGLELQKFVVSTDRFGPDWQIMLNLTPIISSRLLE